MKNLSDPIGNRTRDLPACSAVRHHVLCYKLYNFLVHPGYCACGHVVLRLLKVPMSGGISTKYRLSRQNRGKCLPSLKSKDIKLLVVYYLRIISVLLSSSCLLTRTFSESECFQLALNPFVHSFFHFVTISSYSVFARVRKIAKKDY
jgi:hypothetical protein